MVGAMEIYMLLPKTNCKKCGLPTCMAFAVGHLGREKKIDECTPLIEEKKYEAKLKKLHEVMAPLENASETGHHTSGEVLRLRQLRGRVSRQCGRGAYKMRCGPGSGGG